MRRVGTPGVSWRRWLQALACVLVFGWGPGAEAEPLGDAALREYKSGNFKVAAALWTQRVAEAPSDSDAWSSLALARHRLGDFKGGVEAGRRCSETARNGRKLAACLYNQGLSFESLGMAEQAAAVWKKSLALRPNKTVAARLRRLGADSQGSSPDLQSASARLIQERCPRSKLRKEKQRLSVKGGRCDGAGLQGMLGAFTRKGASEALVYLDRIEIPERGREWMTYTAYLLRWEGGGVGCRGQRP